MQNPQTRCIIVAHPRRAQQARSLAETVGAYVSMDDGTMGHAENHRRCWQYHAEKTTEPYSLVLEDDCAPCDDFKTQLKQALATAPTPIVSMYLGTSRPPQWQRAIRDAINQADQTNASWITAPVLFHAVAVAIRTDLVADMVKELPPHVPIDEAITSWANQRGHLVSYTYPSTCNHLDQQTLITHADGLPRTDPRVAHLFGTRQEWTDRTAVIA